MAVRKKIVNKTVEKKPVYNFERMFGIMLVSLVLVLVVARTGGTKTDSDTFTTLVRASAPAATAESRFVRLHDSSEMFGIASIILESCIVIGALGLLVRDDKAKWLLFITPILAGVCAAVVIVLGFMHAAGA